MPVIQAAWEAEIGGSWFEASPGRKKVRETQSLKKLESNKYKKKY
jgi:hypothetical protein